MLEFVPSGDYLVVKDREEESKIDGFDLPGNVRQKEMTFGQILMIGDAALPKWKIGMVVSYGPYAGMTMLLNGVEVRELREGQVAGYFREVQNHEQGDDESGRTAANV